MKLTKQILYVLPLICLLLIISACSKSSDNPSQPVIEPVDQSFGTDMDDRNLIAVYDAVIDPDAGTFEITPAERTGSYHFPLNQPYPNVLQITGFGFTPEFWADIKLVHPYPGSGIVGFDPRVIAILPANTGNQVYFPIFNVHANNAIVWGANGYTKMYDALAPAIPGNANPYKSYFTQMPYHAWMSTGLTEDTRTWYLNLAGFGGPISYKLVVDVSTNFPNPPAPVVDNAPEPVGLMLEIGDGLNPNGGNATVTATLRDWQGETGIKCKVEAPALFSGSVELFYTAPGPNPNEYVFEGTISNDLNAPMGEYGVLLAAWDTTLGNHNFKIAPALVGSIFNLEDITPPMTVFSPRETFVEGDYAYSACQEQGFYIFSITNSTEFELINHLEFPGLSCVAVQIQNDLAYVATSWSGPYAGLVIVDISTPESAFVVNTVQMGDCNGLDVEGNYAYLSRNNDGVSIVDITNPETAYIVKTVSTSGQARDLSYLNGYVYVPVYPTLTVIDVDPPADASIVHSIATPTGAHPFDVDTQGNYAYVAHGGGFWVVDITNPESASSLLNLPIEYKMGVTVKGNYAYTCGSRYGDNVISVVDISTPASASESFWVEIDHYGETFVTDEDIAFVSNGEYGLTVVDVDPLGGQDVIDTYYSTLYSYASDAFGDYVYTVIRSEDDFSRLVILNVAIPESATVVGGMIIPTDEDYQVSDIQVDGNYAYVAHDEDGIQIIDVTNPAQPEFVHDVTDEYADYLSISNGFAFVSVDYAFYVVDINFPESAYIVTDMSFSSLREIAVSGNWAYVTDRDGELHIIDISNPELPILKNSVTLPMGASKIDVANGYAYVSGNSMDVQIIDVDPPGMASVVGTFSGLTNVDALEIYSHYLLLADNDNYELLVYDLTYPESPVYTDSIVYPDNVVDILAHNGAAYLAGEDGLMMINLH